MFLIKKKIDKKKFENVVALTFHSLPLFFKNSLSLAFLFGFLLFHFIFKIIFLFFCTFHKQSRIMDERKKQIRCDGYVLVSMYINSTNVKLTSLEIFLISHL
jgi:hypothetical protein